ncbi:sulfite oxidase heme-binding subunit YedZ [Azonexus caeni]|jgi:sulfoxide reductase heme-binding subunit YedZ|uniref:sulfite oxidase heme-binding subunit YedZ n=1 Tax=Azonexus caeni TaxID=266126 RepID=UPI003A83CE65
MSTSSARIPVNAFKALLFVASLLPAAWIGWQLRHNGLGPEPSETLQALTGTWTLNFLLLTLCISPARALTGQHWLLRLRRMLGLFAFAYALLHLFSFIGYDHGFDLTAIARDVLKRPFIAVGLAALLLMVPLAATSNATAIRRLGGRKWQELHRNIYLIAILGCVHLLWQSKPEELPATLSYAVFLGLLLWWRVQERRRKATPMPDQRVQAVKFYRKRPD